MPRFIVTGCFTAQAIKGMMDKPSDRWAAVDALITAAGGKMEHYWVTTGPTDFLIVVDVDDVTKLMAGIMVAGGSGAVTDLETQRAFSTAEAHAMQEAAAGIRGSFTPPGG